jgi:hypothetical protein
MNSQAGLKLRCAFLQLSLQMHKKYRYLVENKYLVNGSIEIQAGSTRLTRMNNNSKKLLFGVN